MSRWGCLFLRVALVSSFFFFDPRSTRCSFYFEERDAFVSTGHEGLERRADVRHMRMRGRADDEGERRRVHVVLQVHESGLRCSLELMNSCQ